MAKKASKASSAFAKFNIDPDLVYSIPLVERTINITGKDRLRPSPGIFRTDNRLFMSSEIDFVGHLFEPTYRFPLWIKTEKNHFLIDESYKIRLTQSLSQPLMEHHLCLPGVS